MKTFAHNNNYRPLGKINRICRNCGRYSTRKNNSEKHELICFPKKQQKNTLSSKKETDPWLSQLYSFIDNDIEPYYHDITQKDLKIDAKHDSLPDFDVEYYEKNEELLSSYTKDVEREINDIKNNSQHYDDDQVQAIIEHYSDFIKLFRTIK